MAEEREQLRQRTAGFAKYGRKFDKALDTVLAGGVKKCRFSPSGRKVFTVVGKAGDEFIDPEKPYCSCSDFFFKVTRRREELCYHLLSYKIALETGRLDVMEFSDEEYASYMSATVGDVFQVLARSSG
jgi:predicted nucleic acid-binding Zn finger protein